MNTSTVLRTAIAGGVAAAGLSVGGIALANAANEPGTATSVVGHDGRGGPGMKMRFGGEDLAEALGVSEEKLADAMEAVHEDLEPAERPAGPPSEADRDARRTALAEALAEELDLTEAKVTAALDEVHEAHAAERRTDLSERLDEAVEAGDLTSADKASVLKAYDAGVLMAGPGGHR